MYLIKRVLFAHALIIFSALRMRISRILRSETNFVPVLGRSIGMDCPGGLIREHHLHFCCTVQLSRDYPFYQIPRKLR